MGAFLSNLRYVAWAGLALGALLLIYFALGVAHYSFGDSAFWESALRWLHVLVGICLLYTSPSPRDRG